MTNEFKKIHALGYDTLVPIIPPSAPISERSSLFKRVNTRQDARGKTPGVKGRDGNWFSFDWVPHQADEYDLNKWHTMGAGVGIKTGNGLVAIDADTVNEDYARTIRDEVEALCGRTPVRVGRYPKALYLVKTDKDFRYQRIDFGEPDANNNFERIEILANGKQFVAEGIHPKTGNPYSWPRPLTSIEEIPFVSGDKLTNLLANLATKLPKASKVHKEGGTSDVDQSSLIGDLNLIRKAVEATPNTSAHFPTREDYRNMGYAIKAALPHEPDAAFEIFNDWCAKWQEGTNETDIIASDWERMKPPYRRGASFLYEQAASFGQFNEAEIWFDLIDETDVFATPAIDTGTFSVLSIDDIRKRPPAEWLVARHIPKKSVGFIYSTPGAGKSFLTLDIALHIASRKPEWNGDTITDQDQQVLYIAAEGSYGFKNRIDAWISKHGVSDNLIKNFKLIETNVNFMNKDDISKLLRTIRSAMPGRVALVIVDTVSRAMPAADENMQKDMTVFVQACDAVRDATGGAVIGVHHAGKSGDMRGSTVLLGAGDFVFRLERKKGASIGNLTCEKQKEAEDGWVEPYRFDLVQLGDGETSLTVERAEIAIGDGAELTPATADAVLSAMSLAWVNGEPWSKSPVAKERYAVRRMVADFGFKADKASDLLDVWLASGVVEVGVLDGHSKLKGLKVVGETGQAVRGEGVFD